MLEITALAGNAEQQVAAGRQVTEVPGEGR